MTPTRPASCGTSPPGSPKPPWWGDTRVSGHSVHEWCRSDAGAIAGEPLPVKAGRATSRSEAEWARATGSAGPYVGSALPGAVGVATVPWNHSGRREAMVVMVLASSDATPTANRRCTGRRRDLYRSTSKQRGLTSIRRPPTISRRRRQRPDSASQAGCRGFTRGFS